jgi:threonine 3-dehydrogenase
MPPVKTLITGAGGQVGIDLALALCPPRASDHATASDLMPHEVLATDLSPHPPKALLESGALDPESGNPLLHWASLDVCDAAAVEDAVIKFAPDRIVHLAALLSARGEAVPQRAYEINLGGTLNLLEAARKNGSPQIIFTSTIAVFGPGLASPVPDDVGLRPKTMYGVTKAAGEMLGEYYSSRYGLDFRGVRFPGLISAVEPGGGSSDYALYMFFEALKKQPYTAFCRADTRIPFMYMPDAIRALLEISAAKRERMRRCVYNIAAFSPSAQEIAAEVCRLVPEMKIDFVPDPLRQGILDSWPQSLDDRAAQEDWDWRAKWDLRSMSEDLFHRLSNVRKGN